LEKQNADLVDKNASLEEEFRKVAAFKPLMESYKTQIAELESKASARSKESDSLRFELEQTKAKLKHTQEERQRDSETLELYQERVRELELLSHRPVASTPRPRPSATATVDGEEPNPNTDKFTVDELMGTNDTPRTDDMDDVEQMQGLSEELDAALAGTTMTDLKIQVRKLQRELEAVQKQEADASRVLVLENLLEDANRMKARYEQDYLAAHREKLVLQNDLEEIRSGKSMGDGYVPSHSCMTGLIRLRS
jgi:protein HOOK3